MKNSFTLKEIIERITQYFAQSDTEIKEEFSDISMKQVYYIDIINQLDGPTFHKFTKALGLSKPSITAIVDKLVTAGYVGKEKSSEDKRLTYIRLTEKGRRVCQMHDEMHERILTCFSRYIDEDELAQLITILNKIVRGLAKEGKAENSKGGEI
ncbi:MAG: MarR family transcriptional regulator [Ruminiclostridium sp.]|nr:MarR family transcriptional regulator [Ruminiclostridium sp.]